MRSSIRKRMDGLYEFAERKYRVFEYRRAAKRRLRRLSAVPDCRKAYKETVLPFWSPYGVSPGIVWYQLLSYHTGNADPRYIPDDIWFDRILPYYSNSSFRRYGEDKNYLAVWFSDARRPRTIVSCIAGVFYDGSYRLISKEDAVARCVREGRFVLKPSVDSGEGRLLRFFDGSDCSAASVKEAFDVVGDNFIAQERVEQHPALRQLNPDSLNTLRIISFLFENEIHVLSAILRVGGVGSHVDNIGAGGFACAVDADGRLSRYAINRKSERCETNAAGIRFDSVVVPGFQEAVALVRRLHVRLAHFKIIGWDIAIGTDGQPILIEFNTAPGQNQFSCGPTFGDMTERVLSDVFLTRRLAKSRN